MRIVTTFALIAIVPVFWSVPFASAQPLGTFRWQLQPYCNVLTLAVVQQGGQYQLDGTDNQCGSAQAASVRGLAFQNPDGTIGFGLTIVTAPGGTPVHVDATITFPAFNGTWRDSSGNTGDLIFGVGIPGGAPRPVLPGGLAPGTVTTIQIAPAAVTNGQLAADAVTSANIANGSVTTADLAAPPRAAGQPSILQTITLTSVNQTIKTVTLSIPANGSVVANAAGMFQLAGESTVDAAWCSITTGLVTENASYIMAQERTADAMLYMPFGGTRFYQVTPGTFTVRLVCLATFGTVVLWSPSLNAIFIPG